MIKKSKAYWGANNTPVQFMFLLLIYLAFLLPALFLPMPIGEAGSWIIPAIYHFIAFAGLYIVLDRITISAFEYALAIAFFTELTQHYLLTWRSGSVEDIIIDVLGILIIIIINKKTYERRQ